MASQVLHRAWSPVSCVHCLVRHGGRRALDMAQRRTIVGKAIRESNPDFYSRPEPWAYHYHRLAGWHQYLDPTMERFNSNTKIITVDGPIGAGKTTFAKQLADEFDMLYMPEANPTMVGNNPYSDTDTRKLKEEIREILPWASNMTIEEFYDTPHDDRTVHMQYLMYRLRYDQYMDGLVHLLNTGQGVVFDRSVYSDFTFMDAMYRAGYISFLAHNRYSAIQDDTLPLLMTPHLCIYLDIDVDTVKQRIADRNLQHEKNTKVLSTKYLRDIEEGYKAKFLPQMKKHSQILIYDWTKFGDVELVVEEIESIDFDSKLALKSFADWDYSLDGDWFGLRRKYDVTSRPQQIYKVFHMHTLGDIPELICPDPTAAEEVSERIRTFREDLWKEPRFRGFMGFFSSSTPPSAWSRPYTFSGYGALNNCLEK